MTPERRAALRARAAEYATKWPSTAEERKLADGLTDLLAADRDRTQAAEAVAAAAAAYLTAQEAFMRARTVEVAQDLSRTRAALREAVARWEGSKDA